MIRKYIFAAITILVFAQCSQAGKQEAAAPTTVKTANTGAVTHITRAEFKTKVFDFEKDTKEITFLGEKPVIVDFYATWCGPCKQLSPLLEELALEYKDKIVVYKIDTDKEQQLAGELGIQALPTVVFFSKTKKPTAIQGFRPKEELKTMIEEMLK